MPDTRRAGTPEATPGSLHWTLGSVALLLLFVNLLTPSLLSGGIPAGGTFLSQSVLYVSLSANDTISFLVESNGHVVLANVSVAVNRSTPASAAPGNASTYRHWDVWSNATQVVAASLSVNGSRRFVVNITSVYVAPAPSGAPPNTVEASFGRGVFLFGLGPVGQPFALTVVPLYPLAGPGMLPGGSAVITWTATDLPGTLELGTLPAVLVPASEYPTPSLPSGGGPR